MTRILSYNILVGGTERVDELSKMIRATQADIIGLVEATNADVVEELARRLNMPFRLTGEGREGRDWHIAILSRLPFLESHIHSRPAIFTRRHFLEASVEGSDGKPLTVYVIHQTAQIYRGSRSNLVRRMEVRELLKIMEERKGTSHLVMGDFNSLAPGDSFRASVIARYYLDMIKRRRKKGQGLTFSQRAILSTVRAIIQSRGGGLLVDTIGPLYAQGGIDLLLQAGYVDCFRKLHTREPGYTFPAASPATRIDYIFASPELAANLVACSVVTEGEGVHGAAASDHLPLLAEFTFPS